MLSTGSSSVTVTGAEYDDVWLTVGSSGGATTVTLCDPTQTIGVVEGLPAAPTLTITESDANQMVFEGDVATFDVHATWAAWTMSPLGTASQGWWVSSCFRTCIIVQWTLRGRPRRITCRRAVRGRWRSGT